MAFLLALPRWLRYSFLPSADSAYSSMSLQRWLAMVLFWPPFLVVTLVNAVCLCLDHLLFPGFRRVEVRRPWFVLGIPRSGTTFLHRLLSGDEQRFSTMALWEILFAPSIVQRRFWCGVGRLDRLMGKPLTRLRTAIERRLLGGLDGVHKTGLMDPEEDYLALVPVVGCFLLILPFGDPRLWRLSRFDEVAGARDKKRLMHFYRGLIQRHLYVHGPGKTYLSKNPSFTPMMRSLEVAFPDARFVACVRSPESAVPSQISAMLIGARLFSSSVDRTWWRRGLTAMLVHYYDVLSEVRGERSVIVRMEDLATNAERQVRDIYQLLDAEVTETYGLWLHERSEAAKQYRSDHQYSHDKLDISVDSLRQEFAFVFSHFGY